LTSFVLRKADNLFFPHLGEWTEQL